MTHDLRWLMMPFYIALVAAMWVLAAGQATAGHIMGNGDCWQGGPKTCRNVWAQDQLMYVRLIDQFSIAHSEWFSSADTARAKWSSATGPQVLSWSAHSNDTWDYLKWCTSDPPCVTGMTSGTYGLTLNCPVGGGACLVGSYPINIWYAKLYFNEVTFAGASSAIRTNVFAHEIGHSLGLTHHGTSAQALMYPSPQSGVSGPLSADIGSLPPCSLLHQGIRCIYNWKH